MRARMAEERRKAAALGGFDDYDEAFYDKLPDISNPDEGVCYYYYYSYGERMFVQLKVARGCVYHTLAAGAKINYM